MKFIAKAPKLVLLLAVVGGIGIWWANLKPADSPECLAARDQLAKAKVAVYPIDLVMHSLNIRLAELKVKEHC